MGEFVTIERSQGVAVIRMDRPPMNALNLQMQGELQAAALEVSGDASVGAVIVYGGPSVFAAGADIKEMVGMSHADMAYASQTLHQAFTSIATIPQPTIAAINGYALGGGCEVALCCDLRIAGEDATLGLPEITLGIIPGAGGTQRLARLIGKPLAMEMVINNRHLTAAEALQFGLVNRVVPVEGYLDAAVAFAEEIASRAPLAVRMAKDSINAAFETSLTEGLRAEKRNFYPLFSTEDQKEGMKAFIEKRKPNWKGQ